MRISRKLAVFFALVGAWNIVTFSNFGYRLTQAEGESFGYYAAHTTLTVVNIALGAVFLVLAWRAWRKA